MRSPFHIRIDLHANGAATCDAIVVGSHPAEFGPNHAAMGAALN
jgi:hypothetical protein